MSFTIVEAEQRSDAWFQARAGRLTGSVASDMLAEIKSGESAGRRNLRTRLVVERLVGAPQEDSFISAPMQWGIDHEPDAFAAYEAVTGNLARSTGFLSHDTLMAGCSLDGHVGDFDILVSLKCPTPTTHLGYLKAGTFPAAYVPQMLHELYITGAQEYHFLSFDPRWPEDLRVFFTTVKRDEAAIAAYAVKALTFLAEVDAEVEAVRGIRRV